MEHVVFFPAPDGSPAFRRVPSLEEAVRLVEHLRNVEGVSSVSVHTLHEVPLAFRAYYKVEVPMDALVPAQAAAESAAVDAAHAEPAPAEPAYAEPAYAELASVELAPAAEVQAAPALALVEDVPVEQPVLVSSNGHAKEGPASLGFFA